MRSEYSFDLKPGWACLWARNCAGVAVRRHRVGVIAEGVDLSYASLRWIRQSIAAAGPGREVDSRIHLTSRRPGLDPTSLKCITGPREGHESQAVRWVPESIVGCGRHPTRESSLVITKPGCRAAKPRAGLAGLWLPQAAAYRSLPVCHPAVPCHPTPGSPDPPEPRAVSAWSHSVARAMRWTQKNSRRGWRRAAGS